MQEPLYKEKAPLVEEESPTAQTNQERITTTIKALLQALPWKTKHEMAQYILSETKEKAWRQKKQQMQNDLKKLLITKTQELVKQLNILNIDVVICAYISAVDTEYKWIPRIVDGRVQYVDVILNRVVSCLAETHEVEPIIAIGATSFWKDIIRTL